MSLLKLPFTTVTPVLVILPLTVILGLDPRIPSKKDVDSQIKPKNNNE
jgi:hypothetical protein